MEKEAIRLPARSETSERFSITLIPSAVRAVALLMSLTGLSKTDILNRAVQVYEFIEEQKQSGKEILVRDKDGTFERVHIL